MNLDHSLLLEPQRQHATNLLDSLHLNGVAFDASHTGCGKTYVASWVAKYFNAPVVVICPKVVRKTWSEVLTQFGIVAHAIVNYEKITRGNTEHYTYTKKEYDNARNWWESKGINIHFPKRCLVIVDEVHKTKGLNSLNGEMLVALKNNGYNLLLLSATAATNVTEMKNFGYATNLHIGSNFRDFVKDHGVTYNNFGAMVWDSSSDACIQAMKRIHNTLYKTTHIASRMTRDMFKDIFPDNRISADLFDLGAVNTAKFNKVIEQMEAELAALDERSKDYSSHHFAVMMRMRRHTELLKVPAIVDWVETMYDEGISPVVFVNFMDSVAAIENRLSKRFAGQVAKIVGGQSERVRNDDIAAFQADRKRIMLANLKAGNAGISLHDLNGNYARSALINPSWSAIDVQQALGRIYRANGKTPCVQRFMFAEGTIETQIRERVRRKIANIDMLNDGDLEMSDYKRM